MSIINHNYQSPFEMVEFSAPNGNWFDISHPSLVTFDIGELRPVLCEHLMPGDILNVDMSHLIRLAPMISPVYQHMKVRFDAFAVPDRLIWRDSTDFYKGESVSKPMVYLKDLFAASCFIPNKSQSTLLRSAMRPELSLYDSLRYPSFIWDRTDGADVADDNEVLYSGIPDTLVDLSPFVAYKRIVNMYYRNEFIDELPDYSSSSLFCNNFVDPTWDVEDWSDFFNNTFHTLLNGSSWSWSTMVSNSAMFHASDLVSINYAPYTRDYFTGGFLTPQLGPIATVEIGDIDTSTGETTDLYANSHAVLSSDGSSTSYVSSLRMGSLTGSLAAGTLGFNILDLRNANALQQFMERSQLGGNRYIEFVKAHFGVDSSDARLQIPEWLGRVSSDVNISEVTQTSASATGEDSSSSSTVTVLGDYAGHGIAAGGDHLVYYTAEEHTWIMVVMSVMADQSYFQGVPKEYLKTDYLDFLIPEFAQTGAQIVDQAEIFAGTESGSVFSYQNKYAEYTHHTGEIHGDFESNMNYWTGSRVFASQPSLDSAFVHAGSYIDDFNKIFAYTEDEYPHFYALLSFDEKVWRPLPEYPRYGL